MFLAHLATSAQAQVVKRLPDLAQSATSIAEDSNHNVWVGTSSGAYYINGDNYYRVPDFRLDIRTIRVIDGVVWLATTQGAYRVDGTTARRVPDKGLVVTDIVKVGDRIWLATATGAYVIDTPASTLASPDVDLSTVTAARTPDRDLDVADIVSVDNNPWLATDHGAFKLTPKTPAPPGSGAVPRNEAGWVAQHQLDIDYGLNQIIEINGTPWLATDQGAFRIDPAGPKHIELITPSNPSYRFTGKGVEVFKIIPIDGHVWFIGRKGAFRVDGDVANRIPDTELAVANIVQGNDHDVWLATHTGSYRIRGNDVKRIANDDVNTGKTLDVTNIVKIDGRMWIASSTGAFAVNGDQARMVGWPVSINSIAEADGHPVISTSEGAFVAIRDGDAYQLNRLIGGAHVLASYIAGGHVWLSTTTGPLQVDTHHRVELRLVPHDGQWQGFLRSLLPHAWTLTGNYGVRVVIVDPTTGTVQPFADALVYGLPKDGRPVAPPAKQTNVWVGAGHFDVRLLVHEPSGAEVVASTTVFAVPAWSVPLAYAAILWLIYVLVVALTAPFAPASMRMLMRRGFRGPGSLWIVSILLLIPVYRRYLLIRYRRAIADALGPEPESTLDAALGDIGERLSTRPAARIDAIPDVDAFLTACHIARRALSHETALGPARSAVPVPVLVNGDEVRDLDKLVLDLLGEHGGLTDRKLASRFVNCGGFLFVLEGDTPTTLVGDAVSAFVASHSNHNFILLVRPDA